MDQQSKRDLPVVIVMISMLVIAWTGALVESCCSTPPKIHWWASP